MAKINVPDKSTSEQFVRMVDAGVAPAHVTRVVGKAFQNDFVKPLAKGEINNEFPLPFLGFMAESAMSNPLVATKIEKEFGRAVRRGDIDLDKKLDLAYLPQMKIKKNYAMACSTDKNYFED